MKYTIIVGNPIHGFEGYGIFDTVEDAVDFVNDDPDLDEDWWVMKIQPTGKEKS